MQGEGSDSGYDEPIVFVDHPHPGQGGDFDDEGSATLPGRKDKDRSKGNKKIWLIICTYLSMIL